MFIHQTPHLVETAEAKGARQAPIRSYAASAGHRARLKSISASNQTVVVAAQSSQVEKTSKFRVPNYRSQGRNRVSNSRATKRRIPSRNQDCEAQENVAHEHETECFSTCAVNPKNALAASVPIETIQKSLLMKSNGTSAGEMLENRAMQFFITRTAIEWTGWLDEQIWRHFAVQMSMSQPALKHAVISLALYHEHLESEGEKRVHLWQQSFLRGRKALDLMVRDYDNMPLSAVIMIYFAITAFISLLDTETGYQALQAQYTLLDHSLLDPSNCSATRTSASQEDLTKYLLFVLRRRRNRHGRVIDMVRALARAPLYNFVVEEDVIVPKVFSSLRTARQVLETLLRKTTYQAKIKGSHDVKQLSHAKQQLLAWLEKLQTYTCMQARSDDEIQSSAILQICGKLAFMMIEMMYQNDEMAFDGYTGIFRELAVVFEQNTAHRRRRNRTNMSFILDSGLLCYVGHTASRWCRDPVLRQRLIYALLQSQRREGVEPARAWARVSKSIKLIEEYGITPTPMTCSDIPVERRLRCISYDYFWKSELIHIKYVQPTWQEEFVKDLWVTYGDQECCISPEITLGSLPLQYSPQDKPDLHCSEGRVSWKIRKSDQYRCCEAIDFHFPLPRA